MCADIHYGQEQVAPLKGPNTDERDQSYPNQSHPACNTRPVHTEVPLSDIGECLNGENFYSLKEGQAKILGFLLLPPAAGYATLRSLFGGAMGMLG